MWQNDQEGFRTAKNIVLNEIKDSLACRGHSCFLLSSMLHTSPFPAKANDPVLEEESWSPAVFILLDLFWI